MASAFRILAVCVVLAAASFHVTAAWLGCDLSDFPEEGAYLEAGCVEPFDAEDADREERVIVTTFAPRSLP